MKQGTVFNIQKFSLNDGPGIRTTVFLKGCPLKCIWCHNPESISFKQQIIFNSKLCCNCGMCVDKCINKSHTIVNDAHIFDRSKCDICGECVSACINALELAGYETTVEELITEVLKDKAFYDASKGGVTLSGGEPMAQFEFIYELLEELKTRNIHTCLDTCGYGQKADFEKIVKLVDLFLFDYKETDRELHKTYTGVSNATIIENLNTIDALGGKIILRCPIIPGYNDRIDHFKGIAHISNNLKNILEINVIPFHSLGLEKISTIPNAIQSKSIESPDIIALTGWVEAIRQLTEVTVK